MDRSDDLSGTPNSYHEDEGMATKHNLWAQREATRQRFQSLEARLDVTFEELRQSN